MKYVLTVFFKLESEKLMVFAIMKILENGCSASSKEFICITVVCGYTYELFGTC